MDFQKEIRDRGMKQKFFAEKVGIREQELSMYLKGTRTMPENVEKALEKAVSEIPNPK
jgi:transcriptional regulator with XRE-family HTH domain